MTIGAHVSASGGVANAVTNAKALGCGCFQFFSRPPQGGPAPKLTPQTITAFKTACKKTGITETFIHAPYFINFASARPQVRYGSISVVREELERGTLLGVTAVVSHMGSAKEVGEKMGVHKTWRAIQRILDGYTGTTKLLIELSAGSGQVIGDRFEEIAAIIKGVESDKRLRGKLGVCLDTCHVFASGYDLRTKAAVAKTLSAFEKHIGMQRLQLIHANDSLGAFGDHKDRHAHIGNGQIGIEGFRALLRHPKLRAVPFVIETPFDEARTQDLKILKRLRA